MGRLSSWTLLGLMLLTVAALHDVQADAPSENECRPFIEKALHELKTGDTPEDSAEGEAIVDNGNSAEDPTNNDPNDDDSNESESKDATATVTEAADDDSAEDGEASVEATSDTEVADGNETDEDDNQSTEGEDDSSENHDNDGEEATERTKRSAEEESADTDSKEDTAEEATISGQDEDDKSDEAVAVDGESDEGTDENTDDGNDTNEDVSESKEETNDDATTTDESQTEDDNQSAEDVVADDEKDSKEDDTDSTEDGAVKVDVETADGSKEGDDNQSEEAAVEADSVEEVEATREKRQVADEESSEDEASNVVDDDDSKQEEAGGAEDDDDSAEAEPAEQADALESEEDKKEDEIVSKEDEVENADAVADDSVEETSQVTKPVQTFPEDDLLIEYVVPTNLRDHSHVTEILRLDEEFDEKEAAINKASDVVLKELKRIYENAIKPLETLYKYRDLSNRHFGDPEIFSKPLVLFMGPWSGGKSTILNYLTDNEHTADSIRTGAEPSPAYFNILMHGDKPEVLDGTQLAADWTFSGLQKFGQGLEERLRGQKLPHKLLEKVNIVEIPGILEVRKTVNRLFPFNDACQWFIDRADIIFLVYDPSKLDVGPETEAILDQLKGREYQTRILLNKADQVKPEELLRVQGALIWNISPLMSSAQPPVMYTTSLWSHPYEEGAPVRLLQAQERSFLRDLRAAMDKRIDNKIASARRFAVRVRNHAKMVDCYLTTYYNHKTLFGNKKHIADNIIENPSNYHIYEGLSTLTNISRYDLPDPDVYKDFFRLNKLYEFKKLSETCTYFRGCPINKLDIAIAYDLPELVGKYKKAVEAALVTIDKAASGGGGKS